MTVIDKDIHLLENPNDHFPYIGILDVYDRLLTEDEAEKLLSTFDHNIGNKEKFMIFFKKVLEQFGTVSIFNGRDKGTTISDWEILEKYVHLNVCELDFSNIAVSDKTVIIANFDLSFPVWSKVEGEFEKLKEIAKESSLFIR